MSTQWWDSDADGVDAKNVFGLVNGISLNQTARQGSFVRNAAVYGDNDLFNVAMTTSSGNVGSQQFRKLNFNVTRSMIDTLQAKYATAQPRIEILTEGGDWEQQQRAKCTTSFIAGVFEDLRLYSKAPTVLRDSLIFGDGYMKFSTANGKIYMERVFPWEILVDDQEAMYGEPRTLYQVRYVAKEVLRAMFAGNSDALDMIDTASSGEMAPITGTTRSEMVKVIEAWHLPSSEDAGDGKHIICVSSGVLNPDDMTWEYETFPFVRISWRKGVTGWYSQGLVDELMGIQGEISRIAKRIGLGIHLMAIPYYMVEVGSKVVKEHLNNEVGHFVYYSGTQPTAKTNQAFNPEVYQYLENLYNKAYALAGVNTMEASAKKPAGLESAPSLREYQDQASERHAYFSMEWEQFFKDCNWQVLRCAQELKEDKVDLKSFNSDADVLGVVKFSDCITENDDYTFKVQIGNLLPTTTAGKLNTVNDMSQSGLLTPEEGLGLLNFPDLKAATGTKTSQIDYLKKIVYTMLVKGKAVQVEGAFLNLATAIPYVNSAYLQAVTSDAPEKNLNLLRTWIRDAKLQLQPPAPPAPPAPAPGPMPGPPGDPSMVPQGPQPQPQMAA